RKDLTPSGPLSVIESEATKCGIPPVWPTRGNRHSMAIGERPRRGVPEGVWTQCPQCKATIFRKEAAAQFNVCPECDYHFYIPARQRIEQLLDKDSFEEWF